MSPDNKTISQSTQNLLYLADEQMKKENYDKALETVRKVYEDDPRNMYARAYEERILTVMATKKAQREAQEIISHRMREFIASQEKRSGELKEPVRIAVKQDPVMKEINDSLQAAREKLYQLIISRTAQPEETAKKAADMVNGLVRELKIRFDTIQRLNNEHENELVQEFERKHRIQTKKLYRSLVYSMQKLGVHYEHRDPLIQIVSYYAGFTPEEENDLKRNASIGIYEDLLKRLYSMGEPSKENEHILKNTREHFGITDLEHDILLAKIKNELLIIEKTSILVVIDENEKLGTFVTNTVRAEYPKTDVFFFTSPEKYQESFKEKMPDILMCGAFAGEHGLGGLRLIQKMKEQAAEAKHHMEFVFMLDAKDELMKEALDKMHIDNILNKPFTKDLLMWKLRPIIYNAYGNTTY